MRNYYFLIFFFLLYACESDPPVQSVAKTATSSFPKAVEKNINPSTPNTIHPFKSDSSAIAVELQNLGLVDIQLFDSSIAVNLKYSDTSNFTGIDVYGNLSHCFLQPDVADKIVKAQHLLQKRFPFYTLIIYDGVRPLRIQRRLWKILKMPAKQKQKYLTSPTLGSLHNYGAAVDLSISDIDGNELDMGTCYDYFGDLAHPRMEDKFLEEGKLTYRQVLNRELLREIMLEAGMMKIETEWWHFNSCTRNEAMKHYKLIE